VHTENFFIRSLRWLWSKHKAVLITLACYLIVILVKNILYKNLDSFEWYRKPVIQFFQLIEWITFWIFLLSIISKIPYLRVPLITAGMSIVMLISVEATCQVLYEYAHRPNAPKERPAPENSKPGFFSKLTALFAKKEKKEEEIFPDGPPSQIPPSALGVDVLPNNFNELRVPGEPDFKKDEPAWHDWQQTDTLMGYRNKPDINVEVRSWSYGIANPVAHYNTDSLGRRITGNELKSSRKKYALFFGCSVSFGVLVDNKQTLPAIFERIDSNYRSYNYGVSGYGTHHVLALLQNRNLRNEIAEKDGAAFYIFFHGHISRAIGDMDSYLAWNSDSPFYYVDGDKIVRRKNFKEGRKLISKFYEFFATTYICKYFDIHLPGKLWGHHYTFGVKLIEQSYKEYQRQFGNDNFYVVLLPGWGNEIKPYLDEVNIKYLDYDKILPYWQDRYSFFGDGHPRPLCYKILAEQIEKDIIK
jgi:hypothetical protein